LKSTIIHIDSRLFLIKLDIPISGFEDFVGVWVHTGAPSFIIDVGPSATTNNLTAGLNDLGVATLDYIFLTHIHIDHAGGIGEIAEHFPQTPVICHKDGIAHLENPSRLWKGTLKVLGKVAQAYGPFKPVPISQLCDAATCKSTSIAPILTPGHASHHISYQFDDYLFAGEACGICLSIDANRDYRRPATPPKFFFDVYHRSIEKLIALHPKKIGFGHFGLQEDGVTLLKQHQAQLRCWKSIIEDEMHNSDSKNLSMACMQRLLKEDPYLAGYFKMSAAVQKREQDFLINSIKGFTGYLQAKSDIFADDAQPFQR
jgi:glyoxylase-like metal-dependent hydrolase (beta-lactamase superfamily II)